MEINDYMMSQMMGLKHVETYICHASALAALPFVMALHKSDWGYIRENSQAFDVWIRPQK